MEVPVTNGLPPLTEPPPVKASGQRSALEIRSGSLRAKTGFSTFVRLDLFQGKIWKVGKL